jgi:hypothetical protein
MNVALKTLLVSEERSFKPLLFWSALWVGLFFGFSEAGPHFPAWSDAVAKFLSAGVLIGLSFGLVSSISSLHLHRNGYLLLGVAGLVLVSQSAHLFVQRTRISHQFAHHSGQILFQSVESISPGLAATSQVIETRNVLYQGIADLVKETFPYHSYHVFALCVSQLLLAAGIGLWIGTGIDAVGHLLPIALVAGLADIWSVSAGATSLIIQSPTIHYFLLRFPLIGGTEFYYPLLIGLTDFLFFGIFFQAARRFNLGLQRNVLLLGLSFFLAVAAALFLAVGLPVLPFMAVCFLAGNFRRLTMTKEEWKQVIGFLVGVAVIGYIVTKILHP